MRKAVLPFVWLLLCLVNVPPAHAEVLTAKAAVTPNRIRPELLVLPAAWAGQIPPRGRVNAPGFLRTLYPGQKIALAFIAEGPDRAKLMSEAKVSVRFSSPTGGTFEQHGLKPVAIRLVKAQGADFALVALNAAGLGAKDRESMEQATAMLSVAVFETEWTAPPVTRVEEVQISATISNEPAVGPIEPVSLKIRPTADWLGEPLPTGQEIGKSMNRYQEDLPPGRLLLMLKAVAEDGSLKAPTIAGFFGIAYRANPAARAAAVAMFPSLDPKTQTALLLVLRLGGQEISDLHLALPPGTMDSLREIEPLKDPRNLPHFQDPVASEEVRSIGHIMDQCWSGWMASGDPSYLRALVGLLAGAPDFPAYQSWTKNKGGAKGLNAAVARGLAYQIAGWSIGSFYRTDPHVTDWLLYWENDPAMPAVLRQEIAALPTNPAFRRN